METVVIKSPFTVRVLPFERFVVATASDPCKVDTAWLKKLLTVTWDWFRLRVAEVGNDPCVSAETTPFPVVATVLVVEGQ